MTNVGSWLWTLVGLVVGALQPAEAPLPSVEEVLDRVSRASKGLVTLSAEMVQQKRYPQLGVSDPPESGSLILKREKDDVWLRVDITTPEPRSVLVRNERYTYYQPRLKQAIVGPLDGTRPRGAGFLRYLLGDLHEVSDEYHVSLEGESDGGLLHLRLLARKEVAAAPFRRVELWIDPVIWLPVKQELIEANESVISIRFEEIRIDLPLDDEHFELVLPRDVKRLTG